MQVNLESCVEILNQLEPLQGLFGELRCIGVQYARLCIQLLLVHVGLGHPTTSTRKKNINFFFLKACCVKPVHIVNELRSNAKPIEK